MSSEKPMMAFKGVRSSWLILARNSVLAWLALSPPRLPSGRRGARPLWLLSSRPGVGFGGEGGGDDPEGPLGLRVEPVEIGGDGQAEKRPEDVTDEEHARQPPRLGVVLHPLRREPVQQRRGVEGGG